MFVMKARRDAIMESKEYNSRKKRRSKKERLIDESNWRFEIVKVNEAFQVLHNLILDVFPNYLGLSL
jgi:hypothetical protein